MNNIFELNSNLATVNLKFRQIMSFFLYNYMFTQPIKKGLESKNSNRNNDEVNYYLFFS